MGPQTAQDLIEPFIRVEAPFYGLMTSQGIGNRVDQDIASRGAKRFHVSAKREPYVEDTHTGARWEPIPFETDQPDWRFGKVCADRHLETYFPSYLIKDGTEGILPDIFIWEHPIVSDRAKALIEAYCPGGCLFAPVKIFEKNSRLPVSERYYHVIVRAYFHYTGKMARVLIRPQGERTAIVPVSTWTAFCLNPTVRQAALSLPIFIFNGLRHYAIFSADLMRHLKENNVSGLLETTYYIKTKPKRPGGYIDFETVFPLDPDYRPPAR